MKVDCNVTRTYTITLTEGELIALKGVACAAAPKLLGENATDRELGEFHSNEETNMVRYLQTLML